MVKTRSAKKSTARERQKTTTRIKKEAKHSVLKQICLEISEASKKNGGRKPYGLVKKMVREMHEDYRWINRNSINFAYEKFVKDRTYFDGPIRDKERAPVRSEDEKNTGGRPKGTTIKAKRDMKVALREALNEISTSYQREIDIARTLGFQAVKKGCLDKIIEQKKKEFGIPDGFEIKKGLIRSRLQRKKPIVNGLGPESPMVDAEPQLVELIIRMGRIRRCLTPTQCLHLANDLIKGTEIEARVINFKKKLFHRDYDSAELGLRYWSGFKKRWSHKLIMKRGQKFALDRASSTTFANMSKMYDEVYDAMVDCKVARVLDRPVFMDNDGSITDDPDNRFGVKVTHTITHPDMCLVVDEVGSNLSQKGDGHIGGQMYMCERGAVPQIKVQHKEKHFTLLGFTTLSGNPVLCLLVISGVREDLNVFTGIDVGADVIGSPEDSDYFDKNFGPGKLYPGGPKCSFQGKEIPCMVRWSPKGGITSAILAEALAHIDSFDVFDRSDGRSPFLLLDGHNSRFELPFLEYITNNQHEWQVCIGVPYGTSLWQVADSKEQNGSYKIALARAKKDAMEKKLTLFIDPPTLNATDIIPLVNNAWQASFARVDTNKKAIAERGWNPCNQNLLLYPEIQHTMTKSDRDSFSQTYLSLNNNGSVPNCVDLSSSSSRSTISDLSCPTRYNAAGKDIIQLNYSSGNSGMALDCLVHSNDIMESRERNKLNKEQGEQMKSNFEKAKSVTAMYHFNSYGCKIGKDALQIKKELHENEKRKQLEARRKEEREYFQKKEKYEEIIKRDIPDDKLSAAQLKVLLNWKKRKNDDPISKLKKDAMLTLWQEWKARWDQPPTFTNDMVLSVTERTEDTTTTDEPSVANDNIGPENQSGIMEVVQQASV